LHFQIIARDIIGYISSPEATVLDYACGEALSASEVAAACGKLILAEPAPGVRGRLIARFAPNTKIRVRSLDDGERELLHRIEAMVFTMSEVDRMGIEPCMREALAHASRGGFLHVSLDMDAVDPEHAPGVGTPVRGGLSYREAHLAMETVADSGLLDSMDVVEVNPILDRENATGQLAVELVASALGARIL